MRDNIKYVILHETVDETYLRHLELRTVVEIGGQKYRKASRHELERALYDSDCPAIIGTKWIGEANEYFELQFSKRYSGYDIFGHLDLRRLRELPTNEVQTDDRISFGDDLLEVVLRTAAVVCFGRYERPVYVKNAVGGQEELSDEKLTVLLQPLVESTERHQHDKLDQRFLGNSFDNRQQRNFAKVDFEHPGDGKVTQSGDIAIAQSFRSATWLLFDLSAMMNTVLDGISERATAVSTVFQLILKTLERSSDLPELEIDNLEEQIKAAVAIRSRKALKSFVRIRERKYDEERRDVNKSIASYEESLVELRRRRAELSLIKRALGGNWETAEAKVVEELDFVQKLPAIASVELTVNAEVVVTTKCLSFGLVDNDDDYFKLGARRLVISFEGKAVQVVDPENPEAENSHPHVSEGTICYGNVQGEINEYLINWEILHAVSALLDFLQTCNPDDEYRSHSEWEKIDGPIVYEEDENDDG